MTAWPREDRLTRCGAGRASRCVKQPEQSDNGGYGGQKLGLGILEDFNDHSGLLTAMRTEAGARSSVFTLSVN
jgi:hypothetical protein